MLRLARLVLPALLVVAAACSSDSNAEGDSAAPGTAQAAGAPPALATPMDTSPLRSDETQITGIAFRVPAQHALRTTGGGTDHALYAIAPASDSMAPLVEFYLGDRPQFDVNATRQSMIHGLVARDRVAKLPENRWSREMLIELPREANSNLPTRLHLFYNRLPKADAERADSVIASIRCCLRSQPAAAGATKSGR